LVDGNVNVPSPALFGELRAAPDKARAERGAWYSPAGKGFSAGFDLSVLRAGGPDTLDMIRAGFETTVRLRRFRRPAIIACPGHATRWGHSCYCPATNGSARLARTSSWPTRSIPGEDHVTVEHGEQASPESSVTGQATDVRQTGPRSRHHGN
jgi:hypothetical protein